MSDNERLITTATATPTRRTRKSAYENPTANRTQATWTAARCQRLLRPLSAKISHLRRLNQAEELLSRANCPISSEGRDAVSLTHDDTRARRSCNPEGEDWECNPRPRKKIRWTYTTKSSTQTIASAEKGENATLGYTKSGPYELLPQWLLSSGMTSSQASVSSQEACNERSLCPDLDFDASHKWGKSSHTQEKANMREPSRIPKCNTAVGRSKDRSDLCTGVCDSFLAILRATQDGFASENSGCASLFSMCLKRIPKYITEEELWAKQQDPDDDSDISYMIYSDLEASAYGDSWKPLRDIVRAHGIRFVEAAIHDGILDAETIRYLIHVCGALRANDAAQSLLRAGIAGLLQRNSTIKTQAILTDWGGIQISLRDYAQTADRGGFLYQQLIDIMNIDSQLKIGDGLTIGDNFLRVSIASAIQSIVQGDAHSSYAIRLIQTVIRRACPRVSPPPNIYIENVRQTNRMKMKRASLRLRTSAEGQAGRVGKATIYAQRCRLATAKASSSQCPIDVPNLIAMLSALDMVMREGQHVTQDTRGRSMIRLMLDSLAVEAQQYIELVFLDNERHLERTDLQTWAAILTVSGLDTFVYNGRDAENQASLASAISKLSDIGINDNGIFQLGSFVQSVASCYGYIKGEGGFDLITKIVDALMKESKSLGKKGSTYTTAKKLAIAAAFAFSEETSQPSHLDWALNVEQAMYVTGEALPRRAILRTPARPISHAKRGYRWEEGICEWIAKTPALQMSRESAHASASEISDDSDTDVLAHTPTTTPEPGYDSMPEESPSKNRQSNMGSIAPDLTADGASAKCVTTGPEEEAGISKRPCSDTLKHSERFLDPGMISSDGAFDDTDDTDELSAAQCAVKRPAKFPCSALRRLPPPKAQSKRTMNDRLGKRNIRQSHLQTAVSNHETSDAEDELSFS